VHVRSPTSLASAVLPQAKSLRMASVFVKEEMVYYTLYFFIQVKPIVWKSCYKVRIYTDFSERGLALKGL